MALPGFRRLLFVPMAVLVGLAFALSALLGYLYSEAASDDLIGQLVARSNEGLRTHLQRYLEKPQLATASMADALALGDTDLQRLFQRPEPWFLAAHRRFATVDDLYVARTDGAIVGIDRSDSGPVLKITTAFPRREFHRLDEQGRRTGLLQANDYDARTRDWFQAASLVESPVWSKVYLLLNRQELGLTAARALRDPQGRPVGVAGANVTLGSLSEYLRRHPVAARGVSYIVEADGHLVAASLPNPPLTRQEGGRRVRALAGDSSDPVIAASHRALLASGAAPDALTPVIPLRVGDTEYRVFRTTFADAHGLRWQLVSVVDPSQYLATARRVALLTAGIGALLLVLLFWLIYTVARRLAQPVQRLADAAHGIAQGQAGCTVAAAGASREVQGLVDAFNQMSGALVAAQRQVQAQADTLREQVRQRTHELQEANGALAQARDRAESANLAKSHFLANFSHEVRTPLHAIQGLAGLLRDGPLSPDQGLRLQRIEAAGQHLMGVLDGVLDLSKIESGALDLADEPLDVPALVSTAVGLVADAAQAKGLRVETHLLPLPAGLRGDGARLRQALLNYLWNAVKFTDHGGLTVSVRALAQEAGRIVLRFEVADTGRGVAPEHQGRLFQRFAQAASGGRPHPQGSGLGLAITRSLAERMGGEVGLHSRPGSGSTFWFTASLAWAPHGAAAAVPSGVLRGGLADAADPASDAGAAPHPAHAADWGAWLRAQHGTARLVAVDDDPVSREILCAMLARAGLQAVAFSRAADLLHYAAHHPVDLVLMDMHMPGMDGAEATRRLHALPHHAATPVLATTADALDDELARCLAAGMHAVLCKPFTAADLLRAVAGALDATAKRLPVLASVQATAQPPTVA